jgi:hypothetical protein
MGNTIATGKNFKKLAQMGYLSRGAVYLVIGGLALLAAFGSGGETTSSKGAILTITHQPFGEFLLALLIIGLVGYVIWRFIQSVKDTDDHGTSMKGMVVRGALLISAITHAALAVWALKLLLMDESGGSKSSPEFLSSTLGKWLFILTGAAMIGAGFAHLYKGWTAKFQKYMDIPPQQSQWAKPVCQIGLMARGVVWCIVGWFFIYSAMIAGSQEVKGVADALNFLHQQNYGTWLFGLTAAGLFCFGIYSVLEAFYRRINVQI